MVPLALAHGLWSLICSPLFFFFFKEKGRGYLLMIPRAANLNVRTSGISWLASFLNKGVASSPVHSSSYIYIYIYISHLLPHFSYFIIADLQRESLSLWELCFYHLADLIAFVAVLLLRLSFLKEPSTHFVSHLFFYFILSFTFIFLVDCLTLLERPST